MEVMGLMLGEFVDEYTVQVIDVFAMPQSGTTVSVESVDHVFQMRMVEMLKQTGRSAARPRLFYRPRLGASSSPLHPNLSFRVCAGDANECVRMTMMISDLRLSWAGITRIQALDAGYQV